MTNYDKIQILYKEVRHLDDKQWDEWLQLYDEKVNFGCHVGMMRIN